MAIKKISLSYEGEDYLIDAAIDALATLEGWTEGHEKTKEEMAKQRVNGFVRDQVQNYNVFKAQQQATEQAKEASLQALDAITVQLAVE